MDQKQHESNTSLGMALDQALSAVPSHMHGGVKRYVLHGIMPGRFLQRLLVGDIPGALVCADPANAACIPQWEKVMDVLPAECRGSAQAVVEWCGRGGLAKGLAA